MILRKSLFVLALFAFSGGGLAHQGVKNPAVKARMDAMSAIKAEMKIIDDMAKRVTSLDLQAAKSATTRIEQLAGRTSDLFRKREDDPVSEALPAIWQNFDDFEQKSLNMEEAARTATDTIGDLASLRTSLVKIGQTCKACHSDYRK